MRGSAGPLGAREPASAGAQDEAPPPPGLAWVSDEKPGLRRVRKGEDFIYLGVDGGTIRDTATLKRIRSLAIPPAYEKVWICPKPNGHLQATGRDARGRKQYRYHAEWRLARDADKFERMLEFGIALPRIRNRVKADLDAPVGSTPGRTTVLATLVRLLDTTLVRVGNEVYARDNRSFGLTTLRSRHAAVQGSRLSLRFRGKSGIEQQVALEDPRVARVVRRCQALPAQELFQYADEAGVRHAVDSADVNDYIREAAGANFTAKDFRTWHATVHALDLWSEQCAVEPSCRRTANQLLVEVAKRLGNTVAVCRKSYVHPHVLETLASIADPDKLPALSPARRAGLVVAERRLLAFLRRR